MLESCIIHMCNTPDVRCDTCFEKNKNDGILSYILNDTYTITYEIKYNSMPVSSLIYLLEAQAVLRNTPDQSFLPFKGTPIFINPLSAYRDISRPQCLLVRRQLS